MDNGNDYVIQVKRNQKSLFAGIQRIIRKGNTIDQVVKQETNKGRSEKRTVRLYANDGRSIPAGWKKLMRIIEITNEGYRDGQGYYEKIGRAHV